MSDPVTDETLGDVTLYNGDYHRLCDLLGLSVHDRQDSRIIDKIKFLQASIAREIQSQDTLQIAAKLNEKLHGAGIWSRGTVAVDTLYHQQRLFEDMETRKNIEAVRHSETDAKIADVDKQLEALKAEQAAKEQLKEPNTDLLERAKSLVANY